MAERLRDGGRCFPASRAIGPCWRISVSSRRRDAAWAKLGWNDTLHAQDQDVDVSSASEWPRRSGLSRLRRRLSREERWLRSDQRVLELAEDATVPLLERVRFLAIFASDLDEFFSLRAAELTRRWATGPLVQTAIRWPPGQALDNFGVAGELMLRHAACFREAVLPALTKEGIEIRRWGELSAPNARACIGSFVTGSIQ